MKTQLGPEVFRPAIMYIQCHHGVVSDLGENICLSKVASLIGLLEPLLLLSLFHHFSCRLQMPYTSVRVFSLIQDGLTRDYGIFAPRHCKSLTPYKSGVTVVW